MEEENFDAMEEDILSMLNEEKEYEEVEEAEEEVSEEETEEIEEEVEEEVDDSEEVEEEGEEEVEEVEVEEEEDQQYDLRKEIDSLKSQLEEAINIINSGKVKEQEAEKEPEVKKEPEESLAELVGEIDFNTFQDEPSKFVDLLQRVIDHTRTSTINSLQAELPQMVDSRATQAISTQRLVDDFYRDNSDLAAVKQTVGEVAKNVSSENPEWDLQKVMEESAVRTRKLLGIKANPKKKKIVRKGKKPAIPTVKGKHKKAEKKLTPLQEEINSILEL